MSGTIYTDLRCLQDPAYRSRGIGYHTSALLRSRRHSRLSGWKAIGLVDPSMATLPPEFSALVDETSPSLNPCWNGERSIFIDGSPMTHDTRFSLRIQNRAGLIAAAILYDFIPLDWPGYLPTVASRIEYFAKLARLKKFDLFFPISEYTAWRLSELAGVACERISVTGACVRRSLYEIRDRITNAPSPYDQERPYFVTLGGDDKRKNTEVAVTAVRRLNLLYGRQIPLKVIGHYNNSYKSELLHLAGHADGKGFLEFHSYIPDDEVVSLHAGAIAAIAPSHIEGFSLPVVEAAVCGCPVLASTCAAQMELVDDEEALFQSDDARGLADKLEALLFRPALRASLASSQAHLGHKFHEEEVGKRFWGAIESAVDKRSRAAVIAKARKPQLAFLSPYPPDPSAAATGTALAMEAGKAWFDSDIYTNAPRPLGFGGAFPEGGTVSLAPLLDKRYDGIVSVLGNFVSCHKIFEVFEQYGGPCILHDIRLTPIYYERLGAEGFRRLGQSVLNRHVSMEEAQGWLPDPNPPSLFVERVIQRAAPLMVHSVKQQGLLKKRYAVDSHVLTCCPTLTLAEEELTAAARQAARERLGVRPDTFLIASFEQQNGVYEMATCILALELLRSWNMAGELYLAGNTASVAAELQRVCAQSNLTGYVHYGNEFSDTTAYRDFLIAADAALQLQPYGFGQPPAALTNCICAGLPTVANQDAAESCDAPAYVCKVLDAFSPLLVAEQLAFIWELRTNGVSRAEARAGYLETHNFEYYARRLVEVLGVA